MSKVELKSELGEILYTCDADNYIDAIKKANNEGIDLTGVYISTDENEDLLWENISELEGLCLAGIKYDDDRWLEKSDNCFINMNLENSIINLYDIEDGEVGYYDCNIKGASLSNGFFTTIENCIMNKNTILPYADYCDDYTVKNCSYEFEDGSVMKLNDMNVCFTGVRDEVLEKCLDKCGISVSKSVTKNVNVIIAKDINSTSSKIKKAKENGLHIVSYEDIKHSFNIIEEE